MPELPEVETIRRGLEEHVVGRKILSVDVRLKKIFEGDVESIVGAKFKTIRRFGKVLSLDLDSGLSIVVHVKMTGQLIYKKLDKDTDKVTENLPNKFTHVIFHLNNGACLYYNDMRQFGWIKIIKTEDVEKMKFINEMGPEPRISSSSSSSTSAEKEVLSLEMFRTIVKNKKTNIKMLLMDQKIIGGVGNIYANDALFMAKIDPKRTSSSLSSSETEKLFNALVDVLKKGLKYGGSSENTYVDALGQKGRYQEFALVYGKAGKPCPNCGTLVKRISLGGRGTFLCEKCQT